MLFCQGMDPDQHLVFRLDPDPHKTDADPKHCTELIIFSPQSAQKATLYANRIQKIFLIHPSTQTT